MQIDKHRLETDGLVPAGQVLQRLARDLRDARMRKAAASAKVERAYRSRDLTEATH